MVQQVQALLAQVRELNVVTERHDQDFNKFGDYSVIQQSVIDLRTKVEWLGRTQASGTASGPAFGPSPAERSKCLIDPKSLKISESKFQYFIDESKQYANLMNPEIGAALEWIEYQEIAVTDATLTSKFGDKLDALNRELHGFLTAKMKGVSKNWLKSQVQGED